MPAQLLRALLLLGVAVTLPAQTITNLRAKDVSTNCFTLEFVVTGTGGSAVIQGHGGYVPELGHKRPSYNGADGTHRIPWCYPEGDSDYYVKVVAGSSETICRSICTSCGSSDDPQFGNGSGLTCEAIGVPPKLHTQPRPLDESPSPPIHPVTNPYQEDDGCTVVKATCDTLLATFNARKSVPGAQCIDVDISHGPCMYPSLALVGTAPGTRVVVRPDIADELRVPDLAQIRVDEPNVLHFRRSEAQLGESLADPGFVKLGDRVTLDQVKIDYNPLPYDPLQVTVVAVQADTRVLRLDGPCPSTFRLYQEVWLNLPGMDEYPATAQVLRCTGDSLTLNSGRFSGSYTGGGTVTLGSNIPVVHASQTTPVEITTSVPHGLPTGNATGQDYLYVGEINNVPNGVYHFSVTGPDTFVLLGTTAGAVYQESEADFAFVQSAPRMLLVAADKTEDARILHGILGTPYYAQYSGRTLIGGTSTKGLIVRDCVLLGSTVGCLVNPTTKLPDCGAHSTYAAAYLAWDNAADLQFVNNTGVDCAGICLDAQSNLGSPRDVTIARNQLWASERVFHDELEGKIGKGWRRWSVMRHFLEAKAAGTRVRVRGNLFSGAAADAASQGPGIFLNDFHSGRLRSWEISWNYLERVPQCFLVGVGGRQGSSEDSSYASRLEVHHNICRQDWTTRRISPGWVGGVGKEAGVARASQLVLAWGGEFINVHHNSWRDSQGTSPGLVLGYGSQWMPGVRIESNVFTLHRAPLFGFVQYTTPVSPLATTDYASLFRSVAPGPYSSFRNNVIVPGVKTPHAVEQSSRSTDPLLTVSKDECAQLWPSTDVFAGVRCVEGASYADRRASVWPNESLFTGGQYTPFGVSDAERFKDELGMTREVTDSSGSGSWVISWRAPTPQACTVRASSDGWKSAVTATANGGSQSQSVSLDSLVSGQAYQAVIECPDAKPVTLPTRQL